MKIRNVVAITCALSLTSLLNAEKTPGPPPAPVPARTGVSKPLAPLVAPKTLITHNSGLAAAAAGVPSVNMKILVLAGDSSEISYHAITAFLDQIGVPYTAVAVDTITPDSNGNRLANFPLTDPLTGRGLYQGMIYTNSSFGLCNPTCIALLSAADFAKLDNYAAQYQVRVVSYYTYPEAKWGLLPADNGATYTTTNPLNASFTPAAAPIFPYLTRNNPLPVGSGGNGIFAYQATTIAAAGETTTPILTSGNNTVGATHTTADGRETLALTFDNDVSLLHSMALDYGVINWVTKGVFIGSRQIYLNPQVDDILIGDRLYDPKDPTCPAAPTCPTDYTTATDLQTFTNWQTAKRANPNFAPFRSTFAFVGVGTSPEYATVNQSILPVLPTLAPNFWWVTHTYDHPNFDCYTTINGVCQEASTAVVDSELDQNVAVAASLGLTIDAKSIVTPYNAGLGNATFLAAATSRGIQYVIDPNAPPSPNTGLVNALDPAIQQVPRLANNIYDDTDVPTTGVPGSLTDEYNANFGPGGAHPTFGQNQTYTQVISNESDFELANMLHYLAFPFALHVSNIFAYDGAHSLASDYLDATIAKYNALCNLPVKSMVMSDIGVLLASRAKYNASGVTGVYTPGISVVLTTVNAASIPVTGACSQASCPTYGGQIQDSVAMGANSTITLSLNGGQGVALSTLTLNPTSVTGGSSSQGTITLTGPAPAGGAVVTLSNNSFAVNFPSTVTFTAGSTSATFSITTMAVTNPTIATFTALYNSGTKTASLTLLPPGVTLSGVSVNPTSVTGGTPSTGTVTLSGAAPLGGIVVSLASNSASATVNASVNVAAGSATATFPITTSAVTAFTTATITATYSGVSQPASLTILPPAVTLSGVSVNPTSVTGGTPSTGTVTLSGAAPSGGIVVSLASNSASATVNASVTVAAGSATATFPITTTAVGASTTATITATYSGVSKPASLTIVPSSVSLSGVLVNPPSVAGGTPSTGTVTLSGAAPSGGIVVSLASNSASATVNASVTVAAGSATATFPITTTASATAVTATITAAYNGVNKTATLTVKAVPLTLSSLSLNPTTVTGGKTSTGTVTLNEAAPAGGIKVSLNSDVYWFASVPSSMTIPAGSKTGTFTITTQGFFFSWQVTISASYGNVTKTATLTVNP